MPELLGRVVLVLSAGGQTGRSRNALRCVPGDPDASRNVSFSAACGLMAVTARPARSYPVLSRPVPIWVPIREPVSEQRGISRCEADHSLPRSGAPAQLLTGLSCAAGPPTCENGSTPTTSATNPSRPASIREPIRISTAIATKNARTELSRATAAIDRMAQVGRLLTGYRLLTPTSAL